jgi:DNA-directed RNA polymerase specialized sigma24 family protein
MTNHIEKDRAINDELRKPCWQTLIDIVIRSHFGASDPREEEIRADALVGLWKGLRKWMPSCTCSQKTWVGRYIWREVIDGLRDREKLRSRHQPRHILSLDERLPSGDTYGSQLPSANLAIADLVDDTIPWLMAQLRPYCHPAILLWAGIKTWQELAEEYHTTEESIRWRGVQARAAIRRLLERLS